VWFLLPRAEIFRRASLDFARDPSRNPELVEGLRFTTRSLGEIPSLSLGQFRRSLVVTPCLRQAGVYNVELDTRNRIGYN